MIILERVEKIASTWPEAPFAIDNNSRTTYSQALAEILSISGWLQSQNFFDQNEQIFTYFRAKAAYLPAILGVMRSGMAWVGLDPDFKPQHQLTILKSCAKPVVICAKEYLHEFIELAVEARVYVLEEILGSDNPQPIFFPRPETVALITFTSGSTGNAKGVVRTHRDLSENAFSQSSRYGLNHHDCVVAGYSPSVMGFLRAFLNIISVGGCYRPVDLKSVDNNGLFEALMADDVTALHIVAPVFRAMFGRLGPDTRFSNIKKLMLGGDAATIRDLEIYKKHFADQCAIYSSLGSSETGTICIWEGSKEYTPEREKLPCGKLIGNVDILLEIQGDIHQPIANEIGELLVASSSIASRYWKNDSLTSQKWTHHYGKRYCRTGDLVSLDEMGTIHHYGRADRVVKVNGFLVDPAYVEFTLEKFDEISEAAVETTTRTQYGKPVIEAFIVCPDALDLKKINQFLRENLNSSCLPDIFYNLKELPRNPNGKLARTKLSRSNPISIAPTTTESYNTDHISLMKAVWAKVLGVSTIHDQDNFFDLGADSLNVIILSMEIDKRFGKKIPTDQLAQHANLVEMAILASQATHATSTEKERTDDAPLKVISNELKNWRGKALDRQGLIRYFPFPKRKRIYWCLQSKREFTTLAKSLKRSFQLCGLRSLNLLCERSEQNLQTVASAYAEAIIATTDDLSEDIYIGGNCQGSTVMFYVAKELIKRGQNIGHFIMMEKFFDEPFDVPTTILFGDNSESNLCKTNALTFEYAKSNYPKLNEIYEITGRHGEFFSEANIDSLTKHIKLALMKPSGHDLNIVDSWSAFRARIRKG